MTIYDDKKQHGHIAKEPGNGTDLRIGSRVKERREIEPHLQTDDFARQLDRSKHQAHGKPNGEAHRDLLRNSTQCFAAVDIDNRLIDQNALCTQSNQKRKTDFYARRNDTHGQHGNHRKQCEHSQKRPKDG
ncbi:hypothetical protein D3C71_1545420 [compost metagenome]